MFYLGGKQHPPYAFGPIPSELVDHTEVIHKRGSRKFGLTSHKRNSAPKKPCRLP